MTKTMPTDPQYSAKINQELYKRNFELAIRNKTLSLLRKLYDITLATLDNQELSKKIVHAVQTSLSMEFAGIFFEDKKNKALVPVSFALSPEIKKIAPKLSHHPAQLTISLKGKNTLFAKAFQTRKKQQAKNFSGIWHDTKINPEIKKFAENTAIKSVIVTPLANADASLGVLILAFNRPYKKLSHFEHDAIENIISVIKIALDKARAYEALRTANIKLKEVNEHLSQLIQMKTEFLQIASHQLRTPLTAIRGLLSLQEEGMYDNVSKEERKKVQHNMLVSSERLNNIVNDLLKATELEGGIEGTFAKDDVEPLIIQSMETLKPNYEKKKLALKYIPPPQKLPQMEMQTEYLRQIFLNLIDNAERYTPTGGVTLKLYQKGDNIIFETVDTGIGITAEDRKKLFEKFGRGKEAVSVQPNGSGLGLYIIKRIAEEHKGTVVVKSAGRGKGSNFIITLPISQKHDSDKDKKSTAR